MIIVHVSRRVGQFMRESVFVIGRCYHVLTGVNFSWYSAKLYSDPATKKSKQAFLITITIGLWSRQTPPCWGPVVEEGSQTYRILKFLGCSLGLCFVLLLERSILRDLGVTVMITVWVPRVMDLRGSPTACLRHCVLSSKKNY